MPHVLKIRKNGRTIGTIGPYDNRVDALADAVVLKRPGHTVSVVSVRRNYAQLVAVLGPLIAPFAANMAKGQIKAYLALDPAKQVAFLRKRAWANPLLRLALANETAAAEVARLLAEFLRTGAAEVAIDAMATSVGRRRNPGQSEEMPLIKHEDKLGGPGFLDGAPATQKILLSRAVAERGYRPTLGAILALERTQALKKKHGSALVTLRRWLVKKHGGVGSFGPRS